MEREIGGNIANKWNLALFNSRFTWYKNVKTQTDILLIDYQVVTSLNCTRVGYK